MPQLWVHFNYNNSSLCMSNFLIVILIILCCSMLCYSFLNKGTGFMNKIYSKSKKFAVQKRNLADLPSSIPGVSISPKIVPYLLDHFGNVDDLYQKLHLSKPSPLPEQLQSASHSSSFVTNHVKTLMTNQEYEDSIVELKKALKGCRASASTIFNKLFLGAYNNVQLFSKMLAKRALEDNLYLKIDGIVPSLSQDTVETEPSNGNYLINPQELSNVLFIYTDGSCIGNKNVAENVCPSGWGVIVTKPSQSFIESLKDSNCEIDVRTIEADTEHCTLVDEICGPVVLDSKSEYYLGATVGSNNTAELSSIGEALLWILAYIRNSFHSRGKSKLRVFIRYDSEYAANSIQGIFNGKKNYELIANIRQIYKTVEKVCNVTFLHVKGHSGHVYNDRADELANKGAHEAMGSGGRYVKDLSDPVYQWRG